jgi:hypothetical protein
MASFPGSFDHDAVYNQLKQIAIDFDDDFYESGFIQSHSIATSLNQDITILNLSKEDVAKQYAFPFCWRQIDPPFAIDCILLHNILINDFRALILGYKIWGTGNWTYDSYLFTYTVDGALIDLHPLPSFVYGNGDSPDFVKSHFQKKFGSPGFSEFRFQGNTLSCNSTLLRVHYNGSESIFNDFSIFRINQKGKIEKTFSDTLSGVFYKDGKIYNDMVHLISRF